ncbi:MAG: hypothetical protein WCZ72_06140 [Gemmobacter sp.]
MGPGWFLRMARWSRQMRSMKQVYFVLAILGVCLALAAIELFWGWPEALTTRGGARRLRP